MKERIAMSAFPASATVILGSVILSKWVTVPNEAAAAATGLLTYLAYAFLGAGTKADKPTQ